MDDRHVEFEDIAEPYVTGRLSPDEEEAFEIHLLECRECRDRVALADDFRDSIRGVAAEEASRVVAQLGFFGWLARSRAARLGFLAAALLVLALPLWLLADRSRLERELAESRRPAPPSAVYAPPPVRTPEGTGDEPAQLAEERSRLSHLEAELRRERAAREDLAGRISRLTRPQVNAAIYTLGVVRGESDGDEIELGPSPEWIVLSLELPQVLHETYRVTLLDTRGATVWQMDGLQPTSSDTLTVLAHSSLLNPGGYRFRLEGLDAGSRFVPAGEIPFRVARKG